MSNLQSTIFVLLALSVYISNEKKASRFVFDLVYMECTILNKALKRFDCEYHKKFENVYKVALHAMAARDLGSALEIHLRSDVFQRSVKRPLRFIDLRFDACGYTDYLAGNQFLRMLLPELQRSNNFTLVCPFREGVLYEFTNMTLSSASFPSYVPESNITFSFDIFEKTVPIVRHITRVIVKSRRFNNKRKV